MIKHVIIWTLKDTLSESEKETVKKEAKCALEALAGNIDGLIVVVATIDIDERLIVSGPDIISRGFVYVREAEELMEEVRNICNEVLTTALDNGITEWTQLKNGVKDALTKHLFQKTKRKPMILPVIMNI